MRHSTNYENAFIAVAEDCGATRGEVPPVRATGQTVASLEYEIVSANPYRYTSDDVKLKVHAARNDIPQSDLEAARDAYFSKGQPCFRASPLTKTYGWGVHSDNHGRVALFGVETPEYERLRSDASLTQHVAMRNRRRSAGD